MVKNQIDEIEMNESKPQARYTLEFKLEAVRLVTTDSKHKLPIVASLLQRNFTAATPNQVWTGNITYIATDEVWLYLAVVLDAGRPWKKAMEEVID